MLDRSPRKRGPMTGAEKALADMEREATARRVWQKNEQKKRERRLNKKHKEYLEEQAAKELAPGQKALSTPQDEGGEYDYEGASVKEEPVEEMAAEVKPTVAGPFNFVESAELHDLKQEPQAEQENHAGCLVQANCDSSTTQTEPGSHALKEAALNAKASSKKTTFKKYPSRASLKKTLPHPDCDKSSSAGSTTARLSLHPGKRPHKRAFVEQRHGQTHAGAQPYRCCAAGCAESFTRKDHLQDHLQTHAGCKRKSRENKESQMTKAKPKKKSPCNVCGKEYASKHMKKHMRVHTGERPYPCTVCAKSFQAVLGIFRKTSSFFLFRKLPLPEEEDGDLSSV